MSRTVVLVAVALTSTGAGPLVADDRRVALIIGVIPPFLTRCVRGIYVAIFSFCAGVITGAETSLRRALAILCDLKAEGRAPDDFADQFQDLEGELRLLADAP